jgi:branched-subunit amino acid aminotransferase/4-amino-4-deoxychorismate lyase
VLTVRYMAVVIKYREHNGTTVAEVFTTGTMGELTPVTMIDGRAIGRLDDFGVLDASVPGPVLSAIQAAYKTLTETEGTPIPDFA